MARIMINVERQPSPTLCEEDVEIAAEQSELTDFDVIEQADGCFTIDCYSDQSLDAGTLELFREYLPTDGEYVIEHIANWPPRNWVYRTREIRY